MTVDTSLCRLTEMFHDRFGIAMTKKGTPSANDQSLCNRHKFWLFCEFAKDCYLPPANNILPHNFHSEKEKQHNMEAEHRRKQTQKRWCLFFGHHHFQTVRCPNFKLPSVGFLKNRLIKKPRQLLVTLGISKFLMMITLGGNRRANMQRRFVGRKGGHIYGWLEGRNWFGPEHLCISWSWYTWLTTCFFLNFTTVLRDMNGNESIWGAIFCSY